MLFPAREENEYYFKEGCYILELLNSQADETLSVARATVKPGITTQWHALDDTVERYVIITGKGRVEVGEDTSVEVNPGDIVLIPAGVRQRITNLADTDLVFLALCTPRFNVNNYRALDKD